MPYLAVRVHVEHCSPEGGPLRVVPGSHEFGRVEPAQAALVGRRAGVAISAERGDALVMRLLLLHASSKSSGCSLRRVLHFDFGPEATKERRVALKSKTAIPVEHFVGSGGRRYMATLGLIRGRGAESPGRRAAPAPHGPGRTHQGEDYWMIVALPSGPGTPMPRSSV